MNQRIEQRYGFNEIKKYSIYVINFSLIETIFYFFTLLYTLSNYFAIALYISYMGYNGSKYYGINKLILYLLGKYMTICFILYNMIFNYNKDVIVYECIVIAYLARTLYYTQQMIYMISNMYYLINQS